MLKMRVLTALVLLAVLLPVLFLNNFPAFAVISTIFFAAASWESLRLSGNAYPKIIAAFWTAIFGFFLASGDASKATVLFASCAAIWLLVFVPLLAKGLPSLQGIRSRLLAGFYSIAILGCFVAIIAAFQRSPLFLLSIMAIVWVADIGAYFSGKAFGRHKLAPSISPGKSWEGAIGGWFAVMLTAVISNRFPALHATFAARLDDHWGLFGFLACMTFVVAASVVGDLFESQLKRRAGIKDSSNLLPGHGGVLDRIDALIPVLPLALLIDAWL
ncbi:phosphatidate cytidylyltransferase [Herminiimonas sp. CN]|uniref:phosphatidate cytidylyltransferase n=1 Tax=Herminiimonas sp. CN TaxID=1349818 RepID=UPI000473A3F1|nr:phosphatidate cytidylyltransferase [Herminiimonas sp. CN]